MWLAYKIYAVTENENLFAIRNTVSEKQFILLKLGCLGNACQPQKLINILGSEPWLLIKTVAYKKIQCNVIPSTDWTITKLKQVSPWQGNRERTRTGY